MNNESELCHTAQTKSCAKAYTRVKTNYKRKQKIPTYEVRAPGGNQHFEETISKVPGGQGKEKRSTVAANNHYPREEVGSTVDTFQATKKRHQADLLFWPLESQRERRGKPKSSTD